MWNIIPNKNVLYTSIGFFFVFFGFGAAQQYLVPLLTLQDMKDLALMSLFLLYTVFLVAGILAPKIISILGLKKSILLGATTYWLFALSVILANPIVLFFISGLIGFGAALMWISSGQIISDNSTKSNLGRNLGFQYASFLIGNLLGVAFGAALLTAVPFQYLYLYLAIAIMISIPFFAALKITEKKSMDKKFNPYYIFDKKLILLFPLVFSTHFIYSQTFAAMNLIVLGLFGIFFVGLLATIGRITGVLGGLSIGKISDKYKKEHVLYASIVIGIIGALLFVGSSEIVSVTAGIVFMAIFASATYPVCLSLLKQSVSEKDYIYAVGSFHVYTTVGVLGALYSTMIFDPRTSFIPGLIFLFISFPAIFFFSRKYGKK